MFGLFIRILKWLFVLLLPFICLIRGAIFVHSRYQPGPWISLAAGMAMTMFVMVIYMTVVHGKFNRTLGSIRAFKTRGYIAGMVIIGFVIHGLFFISSSNVKDPSLVQELRELHPIVRLAVSTVIILDKELVITDASRKRSDYERMNLPINERSLHYPQKDGYAYAVDLRTRERSTIRNFFLQNYFRLMGLRTLQHAGTAPHMHISLKRPPR